MQFRPSPPELVELFGRCLPEDPAIVRRKMFGWPAAFLNGNMFAGTHLDAIFVRLTQADLAALEALGGRPFEPVAGHAMKGYAVTPETMLADEAELRRWIGKGLDLARTLPPKKG